LGRLRILIKRFVITRAKGGSQKRAKFVIVTGLRPTSQHLKRQLQVLLIDYTRLDHGSKGAQQSLFNYSLALQTATANENLELGKL